MSSLNAHFGLGEDTVVESVEVRWPSGTVDLLQHPAIDGSLTIVEGSSSTVGVSDLGTSDGIAIFPNPVTDELTIVGLADLRNSLVTITDVTGKRVMEGQLMNDKLNVSALTRGVYVLSVLTQGRSVQQRFVKQ